MGIYKFGNNTYPQCIRRRSNLGYFLGEKIASYGPGNTVIFIETYDYLHCILFSFYEGTPFSSANPAAPNCDENNLF
jgi:hypothetical protein